MADDASHLLRPGTDRRILGRPHEIRFRSTATLLFPELDEFEPVRRANGKFDLEIRTCDLNLPHIASETRADYLVFPKRDFEGPAGFQKLDRNSAAAWLYQVLCVGEESVRQAQRQSLATLLALPIFELCYRDPIEGEARLRALVTRCS